MIAASAGNHALALAYQGRLLGMPVTVVMPKFAPLIKINNCQKLGATVVLHGKISPKPKRAPTKSRTKKGLPTSTATTSPPSSPARAPSAGDPRTGPNLDAVIVPSAAADCSRGRARGEIAAAARKGHRGRGRARRQVFRRPERRQSVVGRGVRRWPTASPCSGRRQRVRDRAPAHRRGCSRHEDQIALAILRIVELEKAVVEGAAATALAACLSGQLPGLAGKRVVLVVCGGNIDPNVLSRVIEKGLVADGRLARFTAMISDRPGGLADSPPIAAAGASINRWCTTARSPAPMSPRCTSFALSRRATARILRTRSRLHEHGVKTSGAR